MTPPCTDFFPFCPAFFLPPLENFEKIMKKREKRKEKKEKRKENSKIKEFWFQNKLK
jgi:hypothetical protein